MRLSRLLWIPTIAMLALAGCGGPTKNVFPPRASIQQLTMQADGSWKLQLRLQNFSDVSMTFAKVDAKIEIAGNAAGSISVSPAMRIGPDSADVAEVELKPTPAAAQAVATKNVDVRYKMSGTIVISDPAGEHPYTFEGSLSPVPGLIGVLR
jgi:hypothetical protein